MENTNICEDTCELVTTHAGLSEEERERYRDEADGSHITKMTIP